MYCPKCGAENSAGSAYCRNCSTNLAAVSPASTTQASVIPQAPARGSPQDGNPLLAAILNLFFGLGYAYLGYNKVMGVQTIVFQVLMIIVYFLAGLVTVGFVSLVIAILLAVDGYQKAAGLKGYISAE